MYAIAHHVKSENSFMSILMDSLYMQIVSEIFEDIQMSRTSAHFNHTMNLGTNIY